MSLCVNRPHTCVLGRLPQTDIYEDVKAYPMVCGLMCSEIILASELVFFSATNLPSHFLLQNLL